MQRASYISHRCPKCSLLSESGAYVARCTTEHRWRASCASVHRAARLRDSTRTVKRPHVNPLESLPLSDAAKVTDMVHKIDMDLLVTHALVAIECVSFV